MIELLDKPATIPEKKKWEMKGSEFGLPDFFFVIHLGNNKYACNNITIEDPEGDIIVGGLACFEFKADADHYVNSGELLMVSFEEAREIALSKESVSVLIFFKGNEIQGFHFVR